MAFPTIPTAAANTLLQSSQATATTTHTFPSLTTLAQNAGDLMIAIILTYQGNSTNAEFSGWGGGFTEFVDRAQTTANVQCIGAAYKFATGSETGTFTVTTVGSFRSVMFLMTIPGAHASEVPVATAKADGTTAAADPAALNPANWDVEDTLWISVAVNGEISLTGTFTSITAAPTNYTGALISAIIGGDVIGALSGAVAFRQNAVASEDVGAWALDVGAAGNSALLIAVRPGAVASVVSDTPGELTVQPVEDVAASIFTASIVASADDAQQQGSTPVETTLLENLGDAVGEMMAFRFVGVAIPRTARVLSASLTLVLTDNDKNDAEGTWYGEAVGNAAAFVDGIVNGISTRPRTTASVAWTTNDLGVSGSAVVAPGLAPLVQEVTDLAAWASGNALDLIYIHNSATDKIQVATWDHATQAAPLLTVTWIEKPVVADTPAALTLSAVAATPGVPVNYTGGEVYYVASPTDATLDAAASMHYGLTRDQMIALFDPETPRTTEDFCQAWWGKSYANCRHELVALERMVQFQRQASVRADPDGGGYPLTYLGGDCTDSCIVTNSSPANSRYWCGSDFYVAGTNAINLTTNRHASSALPLRNHLTQEFVDGAVDAAGKTRVADALGGGFRNMLGNAATAFAPNQTDHPSTIYWCLAIRDNTAASRTVHVGAWLVKNPGGGGVLDHDLLDSHILSINVFGTISETGKFDVGSNGSFYIGGFMEDTTHLHIWGREFVPGFGPYTPNHFQNLATDVTYTTLARVPNAVDPTATAHTGTVYTNYEWWTGSAWSNNRASAARLKDSSGVDIPGDCGIAKIATNHYMMVAQRYYETVKRVYYAPAPQGPWVLSASVPTPPFGPNKPTSGLNRVALHNRVYPAWPAPSGYAMAMNAVMGWPGNTRPGSHVVETDTPYFITVPVPLVTVADTAGSLTLTPVADTPSAPVSVAITTGALTLIPRTVTPTPGRVTLAATVGTLTLTPRVVTLPAAAAPPAFGSIGASEGNDPSAMATVDVPDGVAIDDWIVVYLFLDNQTVAHTVTGMPSGFSNAPDSPVVVNPFPHLGATHSRFYVMGKRATAADPTGSTYDFPLSASCFNTGIAVRYTGVITTGDPWDVTAWAETGLTGVTATPAVSDNTTVDNTLLLWVGSNWTGGTWTPPSGFTERFEAMYGVMTVADTAQTAAGPTGTITGTCTGNGTSGAWLGALKAPAGPSGPTFADTAGSLTLSAVVDTPTPGAVTFATAPASVTLTPVAATTTPGLVTVVDTAGSLTLQPVAATLAGGPVTIAAAVGVLTLTPQVVTPTPGRVFVTATIGALTLTPRPAVLRGLVAATVGALTLTPRTVTATPQRVFVAATVGTFSLNPVQTAPVPGRVTVAASPGVFSLAPVGVTPTPGSVTVAGVAGTLTLSPVAATLGVGGTTIAATTGALTLTPLAVAPTPGAVTTADTSAAVTLAAVAATPTPGPVSLAITTGALTLTPRTVTTSVGGVTVADTPAAVTLVAVAATATPGLVSVAATIGALTLTPLPATGFTYGPVTTADVPATLNLIAVAATLLGAGVDITGTLTLTPVAATTTSGPVSFADAPAEIRLEGVAAALRTYVAATVGIATLTPLAVTPTPGPVTTALVKGVLTLTPRTVTPTPQRVFVVASTGAATLTPRPATGFTYGVNVVADAPASLSLEAVTDSILGGTVNIQAAVGTFILTGRTVTPTPGGVSVAVVAGALTIAPVSITAVPGAVDEFGVLRLVAVPVTQFSFGRVTTAITPGTFTLVPNVTLIPGAVIVELIWVGMLTRHWASGQFSDDWTSGQFISASTWRSFHPLTRG